MSSLWNNIRAFPPQIKYIVGNEAAERFSFYGMRSILVVFMTQYLLMTREDATASFHLFVSAVYLLPLLGAYIADRYLGKFKTIILFSIVYCLGHGSLAVWDGKTGLFWGLALIALGAGGIKACVSAHVGDQFTARNKNLVQYVYDIFYWSINFGSFFSTLLIPVLLTKYGPNVAFGIPGILMLLATVVFWMGKPYYVHVPPQKKKEEGFWAILLYAVFHVSKRKASHESFFDVAKERYSAQNVEAAKSVYNICKIFALVSVFWALFDQHSSSWVLQAKQMKLEVGGIHLEASQIAALNPILVMILIPLFSQGLYPLCGKLGFAMTPLRRMSVGMVVAAGSFVLVALYQSLLNGGVELSVAWQFFPYLILTAAEVLVSITGLEFAYTQAPLEMKSTIMSFWQLTVFFGNLLTAFIAKINVFSGVMYFVFFAVLMFMMALVFIWGASRYKVVDRMQG